MVNDNDPRVLHGALNTVEALQAQLDVERLSYQIYKTVAMNRLEVTHNILTQAATASGLAAVQLQTILGSVEHSMLLLETNAQERLRSVD